MDTYTSEVSRGLRLMFWGELLFLAALVCVLLSILAPFFPLAAKVLAAVSFLISLVGLVTAAHACAGYQSALVFQVVTIILWASINWVEHGLLAALLNSACIITNYCMVARVCTASADLQFRRRDAEHARQGAKVRLRYLICSVVSAACFLAGSMTRLGALAEIVWIMGTVVGLFAGAIYLFFLRDVWERMR